VVRQDRENLFKDCAEVWKRHTPANDFHELFTGVRHHIFHRSLIGEGVDASDVETSAVPARRLVEGEGRFPRLAEIHLFPLERWLTLVMLECIRNSLLRLIVNYGVLPFVNEVEHYKSNFMIIIWKIYE
jgi:hypothetical protein